jgi:hypothetical protein
MPSKVKELADAEAAKAEANDPAGEPEPVNEPDEVTPDEHNPDAPDDDPDANNEVNAEKQMRAFVAEMERHTRAWADAAGVPPETLEACPTCQGAGFLDKPLKVSAHHQVCEACNGYGQVISGSLNPNAATVPCVECQGYGHVPKLAEVSMTPANGVTAPAPVITQPATEPPEVAALRAAGYTVVPPITVAVP